MNDTIMNVLVAAVAFTASHVILSSRPIRAGLTAHIGEKPFLGAYTLVGILTLVWLIWAYHKAPYVALWPAAHWLRWVAFIAMPFALILLTGGYATRNPTIVGQENLLAQEVPVEGILKITRHPVMWGIALWAIAHLPANGDAASLVFFGAFAVLALSGAAHIDARRRATAGPGWERFAQASSYFPFAAVIAGRTRFSLSDVGWARLLVALVLFVVLLLLHRPIIGVSPWPGG
jgi:uncharacterized membrane protein